VNSHCKNYEWTRLIKDVARIMNIMETRPIKDVVVDPWERIMKDDYYFLKVN